MSTITIPKQYQTKSELVGIPRDEYEAYLDWRKTVREFKPSVGDTRALRAARRDYEQGDVLTIHEFERRLGA